MSNFKIFLRDGKLWGNEFPEDVIPEPMGAGGRIAARSQREVNEYNAAVSAAKASAVELLNPEAVFTWDDRECWFINNRAAAEGKLYDIPQGWEVEIKERMSEGWVPSYNDPDNSALAPSAEIEFVARLIPLKEPISILASGLPDYGKGWEGEKFSLLKDQETTASDRTEPTVNTIIDRIGELYEGLKDLHHAQEVYDKSGEFFASLQELRNIACVAVKSVSPPPQTESRHKYEPEPEHPQFCRQCGYAEHVKLKHF